MTTLTINTSQNVNIDFTNASVGERILAQLIDFLVMFAYLFIFIFILSQLSKVIAMDKSFNIFLVLIILPVFFYSLIFESLFNGQTIGKMIMNIKVVKLDGFQANFIDYFIRWMCSIIDIYLISGGVAILTIILSKNSQRVGDLLAGTAVITIKDKLAISHTILREVNENYVPKYPAAVYLSDNDATIIKKAYEKAIKNKDNQLLATLTTKIENVLKIENKSINHETFIQDILNDFNYLTGQ